MHKSVRLLKAEEFVDQAASIAARYISIVRGEDDTTDTAIRRASRQSGVSYVALRKLQQPSRRPKTIGVDLWTRLVNGYAEHLRGELCRIEAELHRLQALGAPEGALSDLLDQADRVADQIRHALEKARD